jgi:hypothetical protein
MYLLPRGHTFRPRAILSISSCRLLISLLSSSALLTSKLACGVIWAAGPARNAHVRSKLCSPTCWTPREVAGMSSSSSSSWIAGRWAILEDGRGCRAIGCEVERDERGRGAGACWEREGADTTRAAFVDSDVALPLPLRLPPL